MKMGDVVKIDADTAEWGRVVGEAVLLETPSPKIPTVLVESKTIRANILVYKEEIYEKSK